MHLSEKALSIKALTFFQHKFKTVQKKCNIYFSLYEAVAAADILSPLWHPLWGKKQ